MLMPKTSTTSFISQSLQVGSKVQLVLDAARGRSLLPSSLLGYLENQFVLVKLPFAANGAPVSLYESETLAARVFTGTSVCTFDATVLRCELHPFYCMHLSFPAEVGNVKLRDALRIQTNFPCMVESKSAALQGNVVNLSTSGALIQANSAIVAIDDAVNLVFPLGTASDAGVSNVKLKAVVHSVRNYAADDSPSTAIQFGVQFTDVSADDQLALHAYAYNILLMDRRRII